MDIDTDPTVERWYDAVDHDRGDEPEDRRDDDLVEGEYTRRRPRWVTFALAAAIIAGLGFTGGALVQRSHGGTSTGTATARPQGMPSGAGMPGGEGFPVGAQGGSGSGGASASAAPVVVGTVTAIGAGRLTVKSLGGTSVVVAVGSGVPVTVNGLSTALTVGTLVSVRGTKATGGSVTATSVVARAT
jgi:hypothetical protein